jgi:hypothetical protein
MPSSTHLELQVFDRSPIVRLGRRLGDAQRPADVGEGEASDAKLDDFTLSRRENGTPPRIAGAPRPEKLAEFALVEHAHLSVVD